MKRFLSIIVAAVIMVSVLPVSHVSAYVTGTVGQYNTISVGGDHSMAIKTDGTLWAWGALGMDSLGIMELLTLQDGAFLIRQFPKRL